ncbi:M61 family metallopeptidase [Hymenobacter swuensis]|uniref:Peptidase M61 domain-containing protein n=1 Tax=Hymenobacter swuensis DY53 TaxID=1227739 RepID=W8F5A5_9BACT|nr:PDZ domain-containing protein [Hymenobacter swuensis]AHJ96910.1 peptidase M61 domain-containing protein [Hymenobacter swuensis DY53]
MNPIFRSATLAALLGLAAPALAKGPKELTYTVSMDPATNSNAFQVKLELPKLKKDQAIYQFAATAPGTYQVMDMGRFVSNFQAFDEKGKPLEVKQLNTNQYQLSQPDKTREIRYTIAETWDTPVKEHNIYRMCGSSLEIDHALLNGQTLLGYPQGMQAAPLRLKLQYPSGWKAGSVLQADKDGYYHLQDYDHAVDSPILLGRLTEANTKLGNADVALYCYSATDKVQAEPLLGYMQKMLTAAQSFFGGQLPVQRYAFLYHFADRSAGAWEHSYSSEYVLPEQPLTPESAQGVVDIAAHEFFHVMTPLNIHSEVIEQFNFVQPTGSEHLWLYEGTTEWASHMMQLRGGLVPLDDYLSTLHDKVQYDRTRTDTTYSLSRLGLNSFSDEGQRQYGNIYQRGALTAGLLDLRLLELSGGKRGLRDVLLQLAKQYGPNKPFSEKTFFEDFTKLTYPEIGDFFKRYVQNAEPLPLAEYYAKVGVNYQPIVHTGKQVATVGAIGLAPREANVYFTRVTGPVAAAGVQVGDQLVAVDGVRNDFTGLRRAGSRAPGSELPLTISRSGQEQTVRVKLGSTEEVKRYVFTQNPTATAAQLALREAWLKNL